jgi:hypothetical protein
VTWSSQWQVILQVNPRRLDALRAQEDGNLSRVSHLVNHDVSQQTINRVSLLWRVARNHNPFQLVVGQRGDLREDARFYNPPVVQERFEREPGVNRAPLGVLQGGNGFPRGLVAQDVLANAAALHGGITSCAPAATCGPRWRGVPDEVLSRLLLDGSRLHRIKDLVFHVSGFRRLHNFLATISYCPTEKEAL